MAEKFFARAVTWHHTGPAAWGLRVLHKPAEHPKIIPSLRPLYFCQDVIFAPLRNKRVLSLPERRRAPPREEHNNPAWVTSLSDQLNQNNTDIVGATSGIGCIDEVLAGALKVGRFIN